jgi:hypothetical protein
MYYRELKERAINLRKKGYSYGYIIKYVPVSKSTLSEWLKNINFSPNKYTLDTIGKARLSSGLYKHKQKIKNLEKAELQAIKDIGKFSKRDLMMLGLGIYIGEGTKTVNITRIINSDPKIIRLIINWLIKCFNIEIKNLTIRLHLYPDSDIKKCIDFWSKYTKIPKNQFSKSSIDKRNDKKSSNKGKLPFGTAHMTVKSLGNKNLGVYLHRRIMAWINIVL